MKPIPRNLGPRLVLTLGLLAFVGLDVASTIAVTITDSVSQGATHRTSEALSALRAAEELRPDLAGPWRIQADLEAADSPGRARAAAQHARALQPSDWKTWRSLGLLDLQLNRLQSAHHDFSEAAKLDSGYAAHFELASFARISGDLPLFTREITAALRVCPPDQIPITLRTAAAGLPEPSDILEVLPSNRPDVCAAAVEYLAQGQDLATAAALWNKLTCPAYQRLDCQRAATTLVAALLQSRDNAAEGAPDFLNTAQRVWNEAQARFGLPVARAVVGQISDGQFRHAWLGGFSWRDLSDTPVQPQSERNNTGNLIEIHFDGYEASHLALLRQAVLVTAGASYRLMYESRATMAAGAGVALQISSPQKGVLANVEANLGPGWTWNQGQITIPRGTRLIYITLVYDRPFGRTLLRGAVQLRRFALQEPQS